MAVITEDGFRHELQPHREAHTSLGGRIEVNGKSRPLNRGDTTIVPGFGKVEHIDREEVLK